MAKDYTADSGPIIRGSVWPPGDDSLTVSITKSSAWSAAAADGTWSWSLLLSRAQLGGTADVSVSASTVTRSTGTTTNDTINVTFDLTEANTTAIPGSGAEDIYVEVESTDGSGNTSTWDVVQGTAQVRDATGQP